MKVNKIYILFIIILVLLSACSTTTNVYGVYKIKNCKTYKNYGCDINIDFLNYDITIYVGTLEEIYEYYDRENIYQKQLNSKEYYEKKRNNFYNDFIKKQTLTISFPSDIGGGYVKNSFSKKKYNKKFEDNSSNFSIMLIRNKLISEEFKKNAKIYLKFDNNVYDPEIYSKYGNLKTLKMAL